MRLRATRLSATGANFPMRPIGSAIKRGAAMTRAAGKQGVFPALPVMDGFGHWFLDRNRTQPFDPAVDLERSIEWIDDLTGNPKGWELGPNVAVNGGFDTDSDWTKFSGVAISGGVASYSGALTSTFISQIPPVATNRTYQVVYTIVSISGLASMTVGGANTTARSTAGTYAEIITTGGSTNISVVGRGAGFTQLTIDNISVREVIRDDSWLGAEIAPALSAHAPIAAETWAAGGGGWQMTATAPGSRPGVQWPAVVSPGVCRVRLNVLSIAGGTQLRLDGVGPLDVIVPVGTTEFIALFAASSRPRVRLENVSAVAGNNFVIGSISVQPVPGNHLVSPSAGTGPRATARVNLLQRTEDLTHAAWPKTRAAVTSGVLAPNGSFTASKLIATSVAGSHHISQGGAQTANVRALVYAKAAEYSVLQIAAANTSNQFVNFNLATGAIGTVGSQATSATIEPMGGGWYRCSCVFGVTSSLGMLIAVATDASSPWLQSFTGNDVDGILIWGADFRLSIHTTSAYPAYQRVGDGTVGIFDYDATGFPVWRRNDGTRAMMTLGTVDMSGTSQAALMSVVTKLSDAAVAIVAETGSGIDGNSMSIFAPISGGSGGVSVRSRGGLPSTLTQAGLAVPLIAAVLNRGHITADEHEFFLNGVLQASASTDQGSGPFGNWRLSDMARDVAGSVSGRFVGCSTPPALIDMSVIDLATAQAMLREYASSVGHTY